MAGSNRQNYIPEIVGLRGLALSLVVLFHLLGQGRVSGGVDVFLFLSGFLLTRSFLARAIEGRPVSLLERYGRIARRLLPAALIVLSAVSVATVTLSPRHRWLQTGQEILASALYYENWELINSQLAYGAAGPSASPLQHFWSMSVQGQFFLVWPLVLVLLLRPARRGRNITGLVLAVSLTLTLVSFASANWMHSIDQSVNYLHSGTRLWQLTFGAVLAAILPMLRVPSAVGTVIAWLGIGMVAVSGLVIDGAASFPAYPALAPVLGAAMVVLGSGPQHRFSVQRALATKPLTFLANISYPLYLWHWPVMVFLLEYRGTRVLGWRAIALVLTTSLLLAWLTQLLIDRLPAGDARRGLTLTHWLIALLVFALAMGVSVKLLRDWEERELAALPEGVSPYHPGALALSDAATVPEVGWAAPAIPSLSAALRDTPDVYSLGCVQEFGEGPGLDEVLVCPPAGAENAKKTIVMAGGSHVLHWYDALEAVAVANEWRLLVVDKDGCRLRMSNPQESSTSCDRWNNSALQVILELRPDAVFTVGTDTPGEAGQEETVDPRQVATWELLSESGVPTIAVRDTPRFLERVPDCIARTGTDSAAECHRAESEIYKATNPLESTQLPTDTVLLDIRHAFCQGGDCGVYTGNVLMYRDQDHMTATYSRTLADILERELSNSAPWLFE